MLASLSAHKPAAWQTAVQRLGFPLGLLIVACFFLRDYLGGTLPTLMTGIAAVITTLGSDAPGQRLRYGWAAAVLLLLTALVPVKTLLFFAVAFALFFWVEGKGRRVHALGLVAVVVASPAFQYAVTAFSFSLRLQLSKAVGLLFSVAGGDVQTNGNTVVYNGREATVDPACAGLHMLSLSVLLGIAALGLLQRKAGRTVGLRTSIGYLLCLLALNAVANLLRIVLLVQFAVPPEAAMHEIVGLLCLLLYVCVPAFWLAKRLVKRAPASASQTVEAPVKDGSWLPQTLLLAATLVVAQRVASIDTFSKFADRGTRPVAGFNTSVFAPGILKLEGKGSLVYVKFIRGFYDTEHHPSLCWKGSGYTLQNVRQQFLAGQPVFTAVLQKGEEKLYTAWWYGNGRRNTTSQADWRWAMLRGEPGYAVVNVTAASAEGLEAEVKRIAATQALQPLFVE